MSISETSDTLVGTPTIVATSNRGLNPEELAGLAVEKIMRISADADPIIRMQAEAFKERLRALLVGYFKQAQKSERTTLYNLFKSQGHEDMAQIIKRL
jgi:hypothetical protein|tara:strand:- start:517 stop:810 length:294 start_codon:yes stop_codon:yes gene_type:complete